MSRSYPKISIVTPSFNQGRYIEEALLSVKQQDYPAVEHIVLDGASTDGTVEILRRYSEMPGWGHLRWISEPDDGQSHALNKGFRMATGDIIGWLNSDDRYHPGCFRAVIDAFSEYPQADIIYGDYMWIDENDRILQLRREIAFNRFVLLYHRVLYIPTTSTFFRRRIFDERNLLDLGLQYAMDYEFFLRLTEKGYRFKHLPNLLADFRWHSQSKSRTRAHEQLQEHDRIVQMYSRILRGFHAGICRRLVLKGLQAAAASARYSEKLLRGYYFKQFRPPNLKRQN
jgi:glycosyltransferase involved in cell wall biosynthesis